MNGEGLEEIEKCNKYLIQFNLDWPPYKKSNYGPFLHKKDCRRSVGTYQIVIGLLTCIPQLAVNLKIGQKSSTPAKNALFDSSPFDMLTSQNW